MKHVYVTVRYADDKAVVTNSQKGLQQLMDNLNKVTREFGMKINVKKTKVMCISRKRNVRACACVCRLARVDTVLIYFHPLH